MDKVKFICTLLSLSPVLICGSIIYFSSDNLSDRTNLRMMNDEQKIHLLEKDISDLQNQNEDNLFTRCQEILTPLNMAKVKANSRTKINVLQDSLKLVKKRIK